MKWKIVDEDYLTYLRAIEPRIPNSNYGEDKYKPFFGELFNCGDIVYLTQISHSKARHMKINNSLDFYKIYEGNRLIAVVNLNYMFPIHKNFISDLEYANIGEHRKFTDNTEKSKYISLLKLEQAQITTLGLESKSRKLYDIRYKYPEDRVSKRCLDFKALEIKALDYFNHYK